VLPRGLPILKRENPAGYIPRKSRVVRDDELSHLLVVQLPHHIEDFVNQSRIKLRRGLVVQHDLRLHREAARDGDALLLSSGQRRWVLIRHILKTDAFQYDFAQAGSFFGTHSFDLHWR